MKHVIFFSGLIILSISGLITAISLPEKNSSVFLKQDDSASIRVMSFNIRFDNPDDGEDAWPNRIEMVAGTMRFHKSDFVGIQEGLLHQLEDLDKLLPYFDRIGVGRTSGDGEGEFSALYYRKDRFRLLDQGTFWLSGSPDEPGSVGWDAALPRIVTWGEFSDQSTGKRFYIFNTHFDHVGQTARAESASLILRKIDEIAGESPVVLTGDFNTTEADRPYKILTGAEGESPDVQLEDAFYNAEHGHHGPATTWNGFQEIIPGRRIDFIFTNFGFNVVQHAILADQQEGRFPSDHLPVVADIRFAE